MLLQLSIIAQLLGEITILALVVHGVYAAAAYPFFGIAIVAQVADLHINHSVERASIMLLMVAAATLRVIGVETGSDVHVGMATAVTPVVIILTCMFIGSDEHAVADEIVSDASSIEIVSIHDPPENKQPI